MSWLQSGLRVDSSTWWGGTGWGCVSLHPATGGRQMRQEQGARLKGCCTYGAVVRDLSWGGPTGERWIPDPCGYTFGGKR